MVVLIRLIVSVAVYLTPQPSNLWTIIGAVIGGVAFILFLVWFILFCYYKCTRAPKRFVKRTPFGVMNFPPANVTPVADFEQQVSVCSYCYSSSVFALCILRVRMNITIIINE